MNNKYFLINDKLGFIFVGVRVADKVDQTFLPSAPVKSSIRKMKYIGKKSLSSVLGIIVNVALFLEIALVAVASLFLLGTMVFQKSRTYVWPVTFAKQFYPGIKPINESINQATLSFTEGTLTYNGNNEWPQILITLAGIALIFGTAIFITVQLKKILSSFQENEPFNQRNVSGMMRIGMALLAFPIIKLFFDIAYAHYLNASFEGIHFGLHFNLFPLMAGLLVLVLGYIFKLGTMLQEEKNLTV